MPTEAAAGPRVAAAARATIGAGSARVWSCAFGDAGEIWMSEEGLSDFRGFRTRTTQADAPAFDRFVETLEERYPWLRDDDDDADGPPPVTVYAGTASFFGSDGRWTRIADGEASARCRVHSDPAWILDALSQAEISEFTLGVTEPVRGEPCERYGFAVNLERRHLALQVPPHPWSRPPRLHGDAWIDGEGRLRRATWINAYVLRPRWPLNPSATSGWRTVEFWDLSAPAAIDVPTLERRRRGSWILDLARLYWHFRSLRRAHATAATGRR